MPKTDNTSGRLKTNLFNASLKSSKDKDGQKMN